MVETVKSMNEEYKGLVRMLSEQMISEGIGDIDEKGMVALAKCLKILNLSMKLLVEQAAMIEDTNEKVTKLLNTKRES